MLKDKIRSVMLDWIERNWKAYCERQYAKNLLPLTDDLDTAVDMLEELLESPEFGKAVGLYHVPFLKISEVDFTNLKGLKRTLEVLLFLVCNRVPTATARTLLLTLALIALSGNYTSIQWDGGIFQNDLVNNQKLTKFCELLGMRQVRIGSVSTQLSLAKQLGLKLGFISQDRYKRFSLNAKFFWNEKLFEKIGLK